MRSEGEREEMSRRGVCACFFRLFVCLFDCFYVFIYLAFFLCVYYLCPALVCLFVCVLCVCILNPLCPALVFINILAKGTFDV